MRNLFHKRGLFLLCVAVILVSLLCGFAGASDDETPIGVYVDGICKGQAYTVNDISYVPIRTFFTSLCSDAEVSWDEATDTVSVTATDLQFTAQADAYTFTVNGNVFDLDAPMVSLDDQACLPIRALAQIYGLDVRWNGDFRTIDLSTRQMQAPPANPYQEDDLYWLSHVIFAEAGNQSMEGMIGVGNVVLNRVASSRFPDTIQEVVNQPGQFDVVTYGTISADPSDDAIEAAKQCLNGVNTVGESLFFINPSICDASWFNTNFTPLVTIGDHVFYG